MSQDDRKKALQVIQNAILGWHFHLWPPRQRRAAIDGWLALSGTIVSVYFLLSQPFALSLLLGLVTGAIVCAGSFHSGKLATSWTDLLDELLSEYDPLDKESFRVLQDETRANGFHYAILKEWLEKESAAVYPAKVPNFTKQK